MSPKGRRVQGERVGEDVGSPTSCLSRRAQAAAPTWSFSSTSCRVRAASSSMPSLCAAIWPSRSCNDVVGRAGAGVGGEREMGKEDDFAFRHDQKVRCENHVGWCCREINIYDSLQVPRRIATGGEPTTDARGPGAIG